MTAAEEANLTDGYNTSSNTHSRRHTNLYSYTCEGNDLGPVQIESLHCFSYVTYFKKIDADPI